MKQKKNKLSEKEMIEVLKRKISLTKSRKQKVPNKRRGLK